MRYTIVARGYVQVCMEAASIEEVKKRFNAWSAKHRNQRFGREGLAVMLPCQPTILDSNLQPAATQPRLQLHG